MPSLEPGSIVRVVLPCDKDKPNPLTFLVRALSLRTRSRLGDFFNELFKVEGGWKTQIEFILKSLDGVIVGMENGKHQETGEAVEWSGIDCILDVLGDDLVPLLMAILAIGQISPDEKKS